MRLSTDEKVYWVILNRIKGITPYAHRMLLDRFGSVEEIFNRPWEEIAAVPHISLKAAKKISSINENHIASIEDYILYVEENGITIFTPADEGFPGLLFELRDGPTLLHMAGVWEPDYEKMVAIIGARESSTGGEKIARELGQAFSSLGYIVVSGFARGIDTAAHRGALDHDEGRTVAVLGCGVNMVFPPENEELYNEIRFRGRGAFLSEYPPDASVSRIKLLARNRIITGMSQAVVVVEGKQRGGTMEAAENAIRQKRPVITLDWGKESAIYGANTALIGRAGSVAVPADKAVESITDFLEKGILRYFSRPEQLDLPLR